MPKVVVTGGTQKQRSLVKKAAAFYLRTLLKDNAHQKSFLDGIHVDIELIEDLFDEEGSKGDCEVLDSSADLPLDFEVRIDSSMNTAALLLAVAHEMVHVKQYVTGELRDGCSWRHVFFKEKYYNTKEIAYFDHPWEIEAYGREDGLLYQFVQANKLAGAGWYTRDPDYL